MISGAMRGKGGDALARHLLRAENDAVKVITPRGLGSPDLVSQARELVALSLGGRTDQPIYHVHSDPDPTIVDNDGARFRWWHLFEQEFGLARQPYCGAVHVKHCREHEHRVYSLVRRDGSVIDLAWDFARREKVSRIVEFEHGLAPVPSKHARAIARKLREDGRVDVADWLVASGSLDTKRPVAPLSSQERLIQERTGVRLADVRTAALAAWHASEDGESLRKALAERKLQIHAGRAGPVVVDAGGGVNLLTRLIGTASKTADGNRIPAAVVRARLSGLSLTQVGDGRGADLGAPRGAGHLTGADPIGRSAGRAGVGIWAEQSDRGTQRFAIIGCGPERGDKCNALSRLRGLSAWRGGRLRGLVSGLSWEAERRLGDIDRSKARLANGLAVQDIWGIGQLAPPSP